MKQTILFLRNGNLYSTREEAIEGLNGVSHKIGQPVIALYGTTGAVELIFAIGTEEGEYKIIQEGLVSGLNIKTLNGESILGEGDMTVGSVEAVDSVNGDVIDDITFDGDGTKFLSDDGTYKEVYTKSEIDSKLGNINTILESIVTGDEINDILESIITN